ncbi:hypothetical protein [Paenibacillus sp. MBLB4367]|uniref:YkvI family membrane protein n=1 Tax=Paenibacillus sp. MBLB4367 TaxID=3384767 RepID=UPI003908145B
MRKYVQIVQVAFTYIGTVVGAGFASGQEILQFFTRYGWMATATIGFATLLFTWLGIKLMLISNEMKANSYEDLIKDLFGAKLGGWLGLFMLVILFGVSTVMLAGAGSLFAEHLHMSYQTGLLITMILAYAVIARGMQAIVAVNSLVVPIMLVFTAAIVYATWTQPNAHNWILLESDYPLHRIWFAPLLYAAFNLASAQAVLVPLGSAIRDRSALFWGGLLGGIGIGIMLLACHYALSAQMPGIMQFEIPMGHVIYPLGKAVLIMYIAVIYGEIFTTLVADVYGLSLQLQQRMTWNPKLIISVILVAAYFVSQIGFTKLLSTLYPLFGVVSLIWLVSVVWRRRSRLPRNT